MIQTCIGYIGTLTNVQNVKINKSFADFGHTFVGDFAGDQREATEVEEATSDVDHGAVSDTITEGEIQRLETDTTFRQVSDSNVTDVVTGAEIQTLQGTDLGQ